jgi:hypothetical protein
MNKNVTVDSLDIPNPAAGPTGYAMVDMPRRRNLVGTAQIVLICGVLLFVGIVGYGVVTWFQEMWNYDPWFGQLVRLGVYAVVCATPLALIVGMVGLAMRLGLVRLPGNTPVTMLQVMRLDANAALADWRSVQVADAGNPTRGVTTYQVQNPATIERIDAPALPVSAPAPILPASQPSTSMLAQLRTTGMICRSGHSLLAGFDADQAPHYIEMENCGFIAVGGQPRVGKTTAVRFLLGQAALQGWQLVICDPHGAQAQGLIRQTDALKNAIVRQAIAPDDIIEAIRYVDAIGQQRERDPDGERQRVMLVIDEFTSLILDKELPDDVLDLLTKMAVKYPKLSINGLVIGHEWTGRLLGAQLGTSLRRAMTHRIVMRSDPQNAEFLLPTTALAKQTADLPKGHALYKGDYGTAVVTVPWVGDMDMLWAGMQVQPARPIVVAPAKAKTAETQREQWMHLAQEQRTILADLDREQRLRVARVLAAKGWPAEYIQIACRISDEAALNATAGQRNGHAVNGRH